MATPEEVALKWKRNLVGATQTIRDGVNAVTTSPTEAAAKRKDAWLAGIQRAAQSGKWEANLRAVTLSEWRDKMINIGIPRISAGADAATPAVEAFMQQLLPKCEQIKQAVKAMPKGTIQDSIARMTKAVTMMSEFKYKRRG